jgi:hypothetical protein
MLYNHQNPPNLHYYWDKSPPTSHEMIYEVYEESFSTYTKVGYSAANTIHAGEELLSSYSPDDTWFTDRGITLSHYNSSHAKYDSHKSLESNGFCLSNVEVKPSSIPMAGEGLFAKKVFKKGEVVTISAIAVLSKMKIYPSVRTSLLINYCISAKGSDALLLPIGYGGMMNHGGKDANVIMEWHDWTQPLSATRIPSLIDKVKSFFDHALPLYKPPSDEQAESPLGGTRLNWTLESLMENPFAPLDIKYTAVRDIAIGEEILLDYGVEWEIAWQIHLERLIRSAHRTTPLPISTYPQFRHAITAPKALFPCHFYEECILSKVKHGVLGCEDVCSSVSRETQWERRSKEATRRKSSDYLSQAQASRQHVAQTSSNVE